MREKTSYLSIGYKKQKQKTALLKEIWCEYVKISSKIINVMHLFCKDLIAFDNI
jgi:hypothetical protein